MEQTEMRGETIDHLTKDRGDLLTYIPQHPSAWDPNFICI